MKKIKSLCLILLFLIATIFCYTACNPNDEGGNENPSDTKAPYEITVDASKVSVDINNISVCIYSLDGILVGEKKLFKGKTQFELDADNYVATLSGLPEEISYSSVFLTRSTKKSTIVLKGSVYNEYTGTNEFAFTVIVIAGDRNLADLDVQICDDSSCRSVKFENSNVAARSLSAGKYEVKVYFYSDDGAEELYHEDYTVTLDKRFCVIVL